MFDEQPLDAQYEYELEDKFRECMASSVTARRAYDAAKSFGMTEEQRLKSAVIQVVDLNRRAMAIIANAISHGMPITEEIADVRNQIVVARQSCTDP